MYASQLPSLVNTAEGHGDQVAYAGKYRAGRPTANCNSSASFPCTHQNPIFIAILCIRQGKQFECTINLSLHSTHRNFRTIREPSFIVPQLWSRFQMTVLPVVLTHEYMTTRDHTLSRHAASLLVESSRVESSRVMSCRCAARYITV